MKGQMKKRDNLLFDESRGEWYKKDWHEYYPAIIRLVPPNSDVLDCGCGRGGLLAYLRDKKNCRVKGLDLSDDAIRICREKGIEVIKCDLDEDTVPGTYDVIILSSTLESLIDPVSVLKKLRDNLNENGCLVVGVPNFSHLLARIQFFIGKNVKVFGNSKEDRKFGIWGYDDIHFFNKPTLSHVLAMAGYKPVEWSYIKSSELFGLYKLNCALLSSFIAVKAVKKGE